jgi:hypothetical protein
MICNVRNARGQGDVIASPYLEISSSENLNYSEQLSARDVTAAGLVKATIA